MTYSPTIPAAAVRFIQPGLTKVIIVPVVAAFATTGPTGVEITAGNDVSGDLAEINGFQTDVASIAVPDFAARLQGAIPGRITLADSSLAFYRSPTGADIRSILTQDLKTYVVILDNGKVSGSSMDVYKVTVSSVTKPRPMEDASRIVVNFTLQGANESLTSP